MRKTVKKFFGLWNLDKEEKWLNEMAAEGWCLISVGYCKYEFEQVPPGLFTVRTDYLEKSANHPMHRDYIEFVKSTGAVHVCNYGNKAYFRKIKDENFELFSDNPTRIKYYNRILKDAGFMTIWSIFMTIFTLIQVIFEDYNDILVLDLLSLALWLVTDSIWTYAFVKNWKKRKALKEQQNLFE